MEIMPQQNDYEEAKERKKKSMLQQNQMQSVSRTQQH